MLAVQVNYWNYVEQARHNRATEALTSRELDIKEGTLQESIRHNVQTEQQGWFNAAENQRHNIETEHINWFNAQENQRHNVETEHIAWFNAEENQRHNLSNEAIGWANVAELSRHNRAEEAIGQFKADTERFKTGADIAESLDRRRKIRSEETKTREDANYRANENYWFDVNQMKSWVPIVNLGGK